MHGGPRHESCSSGFLREKLSAQRCCRGARWDRAPAAAAGLREGRRGSRASPPPAEATQAAHRRRRRRARRPALRTQELLRTRALRTRALRTTASCGRTVARDRARCRHCGAQLRGEPARDHARWREMARGGARWREVARGGARWREMARGRTHVCEHSRLSGLGRGAGAAPYTTLS